MNKSSGIWLTRTNALKKEVKIALKISNLGFKEKTSMIRLLELFVDGSSRAKKSAENICNSLQKKTINIKQAMERIDDLWVSTFSAVIFH